VVYICTMTHRHFFILAGLLVWFTWLGYWIYMSGKVKATAREYAYPGKGVDRLLIFISAVLLGVRQLGIGWLGYALIPRNDIKGITGLSLTVIGVAISIWARKILGDNWNAQPSVKENHALIQAGPYKIVRHPIYTGILIAVLGTAITIGQVRGFIAFGLSFYSLWHKSTFEEDLMRQEFPQQYEEYTRRVKRLIPWVF